MVTQRMMKKKMQGLLCTFGSSQHGHSFEGLPIFFLLLKYRTTKPGNDFVNKRNPQVREVSALNEAMSYYQVEVKAENLSPNSRLCGGR